MAEEKFGREFEDYDSSAQVYDNYRQTPGKDQILAALQSACPGEGKGAVLEVGCGTGNYMVHFAGKFERLAGIDLNGAMVEKAKTKLGDQAEFKVGPAQSLPWEDNTFDAVYGCQTIHHYGEDTNRIVFFQEVARVLKPGGKLVLNYTEPSQIPFYWPVSLVPLSSYKNSHNERTSEQYIEMAKASLEYVEKQKVTEPFLKSEIYDNMAFLLDEKATFCDSTFSYASDEEKTLARKIVQKCIDTKNFQFKETLDTFGKEYGFSSILIWKKA